MALSFARLRGLLLRLVRQRALAFIVGLLLAAPAAWIEFSGRFDQWWAQGFALIAGATGVAMIWMSVAGRKQDWIDPDE
jgi:hypothetical protein